MDITRIRRRKEHLTSASCALSQAKQSIVQEVEQARNFVDASIMFGLNMLLETLDNEIKKAQEVIDGYNEMQRQIDNRQAPNEYKENS